MDIKTLKEIIYNVNHICAHIEHSRNGVKKLNFEDHKQVYTDVHRLLDIYICSLIDEIKIFEKFSKKENNYYLTDTFYVSSPTFGAAIFKK